MVAALGAAVDDLFVGQYGIITMALSYGLAIILPIVATFFIAFGILEDSGYRPRLAVMANRPFKAMGLNGKAVLPMVLEVRKEGGRSERREWTVEEQVKDAKDRWRDFRFDGAVVQARIDPDGLYLQDSSLSDNSWRREANGRPAVKWSVRFVAWLENALMSYGRFF